MKKIKIFTILLLSMFLLSTVMAANTVSWAEPADESYVSGTAVRLNATIDSNLALNNVSYYYRAPDSSTWVLIGSRTNASAHQNSTFNMTWSTTSLVDGAYTLNATAGSNVDVASEAVITAHINNGVPTVVLANNHFHNNFKAGPSNKFTIAINSDNTIGIDNCTVTFTNTRTNVVSATEYITASGNACSATYQPTDITGLERGSTYNVLISAMDGNGNTTSASSRILTYTAVSGNVVNIPQQVSEMPTTAFERAGRGLQNALSRVPEEASRIINNIRNMFRNLFKW